MWNKPPFTDPRLGPSAPSEAPQAKDVDFLPKGGRNRWARNCRGLNTKTRGNIRFRPLDDNDSTDSDAEGLVSEGGTHHVNLYPRLTGTGSVTSIHSSTPTVLAEGVHSHVVGGKGPHRAVSTTRLSTSLEGSNLPDYYDHEVDTTSSIKSVRYGPGWTPRFLQNAAQLPKPQPENPPTDQVFPGTGWHSPSRKNSKESSRRHEGPRWQAFWRDVNEKIQHKEIS